MSKPYYETEEYSEAENELDTYDDKVKLVMEYRISEKHKDQQIADLQHRLEVAERATKLACEEMDNSGCVAICNYCPYNLQEICPNECPQSTILLEKYFKEQAEKEAKGE